MSVFAHLYQAFRAFHWYLSIIFNILLKGQKLKIYNVQLKKNIVYLLSNKMSILVYSILFNPGE